MDDPIISFIKDFLWAPVLGLVAWAWTRNEKEHDMMRQDNRRLEDSMLQSGSTLNDRIMEHIDSQISEVKSLVREEDRKLSEEQATQRGHIGKIFDKMEAHAQRSEDRHVETLNAIHSLATTMHQALAGKADK